MWKHLWTHSDPPPDYLLMQLCDRFGAGILLLDRETVDRIVAMWQVEVEVENAKRRNLRHPDGSKIPT